MSFHRYLTTLFAAPVHGSASHLAGALVRTGLVGSALASCAALQASEPQELPIEPAKTTRAEPVDFAEEILPLFKRNCLACHHSKEAEGGLVVESHADLMKGGISGAGIVPGDVDASQVFARASGRTEPLMPPEGNSAGAETFTPEELSLLQLWIQQGAPSSEASDTESLQWQPIPKPLQPVYALASSPDGRFVASGEANRVTVYDAASMRPVDRLADPELSTDEQPAAGRDIVQSIAFSPDGKTIATGGFRAVRLWHLADRRISTAQTAFANAAGLVAANQDRSRVAVVNAVGDIEIWDAQQSKRTARLQGHHGTICGLVWPAQSERLFSIDETGTLRVWQSKTGARLLEINTGTVPADLAVSADGRNIAVVGHAGNVHVWSVKSRAEVDFDTNVRKLVAERTTGWDQPLQASFAKGDAVVITFAAPPASQLAVGTKSGKVLLVDLVKKTLVRSFDHGAPLKAIAIGGKPQRILSAAEDGTNRLWDIQSGEAVAELGGDPILQRKRDAAKRDVERQEAYVKRLTEEKGELETRAKSESEAVAKAKEDREQAAKELKAAQEKLETAEKSLATSEQERAQTKQAIAQTRAKKEANERKLEQAEPSVGKADSAKTDSAKVDAAKIDIAALKEQTESAHGQIEELTAKLEQQKAAIDKHQKQVEEAKTARSERQQTLAKREQAVDAAAQASRRAEAAVARQQRRIGTEQRRSEALQRRLADQEASLTASKRQPLSAALFAGAEGKRIAMAAADGTVRLLRAADGTALDQFQIDSLTPQGLLMISAEQLVAFGPDGPAQLYSLHPEWKLQRTIGSPGQSVISDRATAIDFHPDGQALAVGSGPPSRFGEVKIFALPSGQVLRQWEKIHSDTVLGLQFSPSGRRLASAAADKTVRLLDVVTGEQQQSLEGHGHHVLAVAWQADGQTIASASADQTVKVWDAETAEQKRTIEGFPKEVTALTFVGQSSQIATACADGHARLHDVTNGKAIRSFNAGGDFLFTAVITENADALVAGGQSGVLRSWTLSNGQLRQQTASN